MKSLAYLALVALAFFSSAVNASPAMMANPGYGYVGFQSEAAGLMGMRNGSANIYVDMYPFADDAMAGAQLDGYAVANVPALGGMFIFIADVGWLPWDQQNLVPALRLANCTVATPCTQLQFEIFHGMDANDPAVQAILNGASIYLGYARAGEGIDLSRVRKFTASDMLNPAAPISISSSLCASGMPMSRFCM